ncbi:MAG TPA: type II toxin-antitoxin system VapC family toxin [Solirubrobacteraceae bacterium]|jgi:predicted nucleic acid-binding protein|nr:type II toxin-antitoxin system VapC family toxin [Solirubrobacteraceae bacterium]
MSKPELCYLDASALVKLVRREPETGALVAALGPDSKLVSSEIAEVEMLRALRRRAGDEAARLGQTKLENVRLLPLDSHIRRRACELEPVELRSLDAVHLATALHLGGLLKCVYAYDKRLIESARNVGLPVAVPGEDDQVR